ncbi:MAG: hypothetical protein R3B65_02575 [Candidatus Paceibacterota bacterium]
MVSVITIFIGAVVYVPALKFAEKETGIVYQKVPVPVYISVPEKSPVEKPEEEEKFIPLTKNSSSEMSTKRSDSYKNI